LAVLIGRESECARLDVLLDRARMGKSGVLALRGEAGIGKTALLDYAAERADGMTVVRATGVDSEAELEFSALLEVCRPLLDHLTELPEKQAEALRSALGMGSAAAEDRFTIGAATLGLLATAADSNPLLVIVDDAQWLDRSSADALLFAARRLVADRALVLYAVRDGDERLLELPGIESISLTGLTREASASLLRSSAAVAPEVADLLYEGTGGNPLALMELPSILAPEQLAGVVPLEQPLPAGSGIEQGFARRARSLPEEAARALLVAAAAASSAPDVILDALASLGLGASSLERAEDAGLVRLVDGRLEFRHSLVRSAVYQAAVPSERRAAHRSLAQACGDARPEERAWHLAAAALGPDEEVASALERAASEARQRSGFAAAAAALERAVRLSVDEEARLRRLVGAAEASWEAGNTDHAIALIEEGIERAGELPIRSQLLHLRGHVEHLGGRVLDAHDMLESTAVLVAASDPVRAVAILADAAEAALYAGRPSLGLAAAQRARDLAPRDAGVADLLADLVLAEACFFSGDSGAASELLDRVIAGLEANDLLRDDPRYLARVAIELGVCERTAEARQAFERAIELAHARGSVGALPYALEAAAWNDTRAGRWREAYAAAAQAKAVALETGQTSLVAHCDCALAWIDAARGNEALCRENAEEAVRLAGERQLDMIRWWGSSALALLEIGQGRLEAAVPRLQEVALELERNGMHDRDSMPWPELVEAHVRRDERAEAEQALAAFLTHGVPGRSWGAAVVERCRGLLAADDEFEPHFVEALALHGRTDDRFALARTLLCFGERLRRVGRRVDARRELRAALTAFEGLQAEPWAERARKELRASGETLRRRESHEEEQLTPQELQIALQVAEGRSNKEVGAALFLSHRTIEFHLGRIYRKLGLHSRAELIRLFVERDAAL
jgi:DNA-binding CsgD family transcriptional regulator